MSSKPRLHVLGLPHTQTTRKYLHCAYTQKILKFCDMMARDHEVILYSGEENEAKCTEHVPLLSERERLGWYGPWDPNDLFGRISWDPAEEPWAVMHQRAQAEIAKRAEPEDILCLVTSSQGPVASAFPNLMPVEWAVGYEGIGPHHHVFESYAWMHHVYGLAGIRDGHSFDTVIPNFFDPADFTPSYVKDTFLLFVGRVISRKGPHVAAEIAKRAGMHLVVAGPGQDADGSFPLCPELRTSTDVEYVGPVNAEERAELMCQAAAVVVPTLYVEPFGGVAVEAMMSGTPVVASDWGAFTETVLPGVSGERFSTLAEGAQAVERALRIPPQQVLDYALGRYSLDAVHPHFDFYFRRLNTLWRDGWYT